jgi:hypothetical protein
MAKRNRLISNTVACGIFCFRPLPATVQANAPGPTTTSNVSACRKSETLLWLL